MTPKPHHGLKLQQDRRMKALRGFIAAYEAEHGEITPDEVREAVQRARARAIVVQPTQPVSQPGPPPAGRRK